MKILKWSLGIVFFLAIVGYFGFSYMKKQTKKASPEEVIEYKMNDLELSVFYCRPYKKERIIFGELVPYNEVWRTGANEPTTFSTNKLIDFGGKKLNPGTYSLWTIPQKNQWTIILNSKIPGWGVGWGAEANRNAKHDVLKINVPTQDLNKTVEQLTMKFEYNVNLSISWDQTKVMIPIMF